MVTHSTTYWFNHYPHRWGGQGAQTYQYIQGEPILGFPCFYIPDEGLLTRNDNMFSFCFAAVATGQKRLKQGRCP